MKEWIVTLGAIVAVPAALPAQTIPTSIAKGLHYYQYDDGTAESTLKLLNPTAPGEAYSVDFDDDAHGKLIMGVQVSTMITSSSPLGIASISVCPDDLALDPFGHTPDLASPLSSLSNPTGQPGWGTPY